MRCVFRYGVLACLLPALLLPAAPAGAARRVPVRAEASAASLESRESDALVAAPTPKAEARNAPTEETPSSPRFVSARVDPAVREQHEQSALLFAKKKDWDEAAAHARRSGSAPLQALVQWMRLKDPDTTADFEDYAYFLKRPKEWPDMPALLARAQETVMLGGAVPGEVKQWWAFAQKIDAQKKPAADPVRTFIREAWVAGDYNAYEETILRQKFAAVLHGEDDLDRAERLIWEDKLTAAKRMLPLLPADIRTLHRARLALLQKEPNAPALYNALNAAQKNTAGVQYAVMRWDQAQGNNAAAEKIMLHAAKGTPYGEKWWRIRSSLVRDAIEAGNYRDAEKLLMDHGITGGDELTDALWLEGWLKLEFRKQPKEAYKIFYRLFELSKFPASKSRAAYWAGRAAEANGNKEIAQGWFTQGAAYPTQFYGQLCALRHFGAAPLKLPAMPQITAEDRRAVARRPAAEALIVLIDQDETPMANKFLQHLIDTSGSSGEVAQLVALATESRNTYLGVKAAKAALRANVVLTGPGWPRIKFGFTPPIEPALALAITRQESEFRRDVRSSANAIGLMQLLPTTAAHTAKRNDIPYKNESELTDPNKNLRLGSAYLGGLVAKYDGNYMLAIAAYNAGPTNVNRWIGRFGTPGQSLDQTLRWLEQIPFSETRNYVQRVLENLQIYRHLLADKSAAPTLALERDLVHSTHLTELPTE